MKIENEEKLAELFNAHFVDKIVNLKENIDKDYIGDTLKKMKKKFVNNQSKFSLKKITQKQLTKMINKLKKKRSSGLEGLTQKHLMMGGTS